MNQRFILKNLMLILTLCFGTSSLSAASFVVDSATDDGTGLTLREAIADALGNADATDDITFDASIDGTPIALTAGEIAITMPAGEDLTITGNGIANTIVDGNANGRIFNISGGGTVTIESTDITNGAVADNGGGILISGATTTLTLDGVSVSSNTASGAGATNGGGGIYNDGATVTIQNASIVLDNIADGASGSGGGIFNGGTLVVTSSFITDNTANRAGGGIEAIAGSATTLTDVALDDNNVGVSPAVAAPGNGGGMHITGAGTLVVTGGTVNGNVAASEGGGLWNGASTMDIDGVTIDGNTASGDDPDNGGGGVFNFGATGTVTITNATTIINNVADGAAGSGGGILNQGILNIFDSFINNNTANRAGGGIEGTATSVTTLDNVLLDDNNAGVAPAVAAPGNGGGMHISGAGTLVITDGTVNGNVAASEGGGLWNGISTMDIDDVTIDGNTASGNDATNGGGGIFNAGGIVNIGLNSVNVPSVTISNNTADGMAGSGGGIFNDAAGTINTVNVDVVFNTANRAGGGIEATAGTTTVLDGAFLNDNNAGITPTVAAPGNGGGMHISGDGNLTLTGSNVERNTAASEGGGLWNGTGTMDIDLGVIDGNTASGDDADNGGGGVFNAGGTVDIFDTGVSNNVADGASGSGGGILNDASGTLIVEESDITDNTSNRAGGGIEATDGTTNTLTTVNLVDNDTGSASGNGGGMHITMAGNLDFLGGNVTGNTAASEGGGLWNGTGTMNIDDVLIDDNTASGDDATNGGGGIFNAGGTVNIGLISVNIPSTTISNNVADGTSGSGGGIFNDAGGVVNTLFIDVVFNTANRAGGGIEATAGTTTVLDGIFLNDNNAGVAPATANPGNGGGMHISGDGDVNILGTSDIRRNTAASEGGGLWNGTGTMDIDDTIIDSNIASGDAANNGGGGIFNAGGTVNIGNPALPMFTEITNNIADGAAGSGGGIFNDAGGEVNLQDILIFQNQANRAGGGIEATAGTTTTIDNCALANNNAGVAPAVAAPGNGGGMHISGDGNLDIMRGFVNNNIAAAEGGALWNGTGVMNIDNVNIDSNTASGAAADQGGGGVFNAGGTVNVTNNAAITNNVADGALGSGGGILNDAGGILKVENTKISGNSSVRAGGGIEDNSLVAVGSVTLANVALLNNNTGASPGNGGGLHMTGPGTSIIKSCEVDGNTAAAEGGGLWNGSGSMSVNATTINGNTASGAAADQGGGGLFNAGGTLTVLGSQITANIADGASGSGGGILNDANGTLIVTQSSIADNTASRAGGGIEATDATMTTLTSVDLVLNEAGPAPGNGGGMHITNGGDADITGGNVLGNTAAREGGGLWNGSGEMNVTEVTIDGNTASGPAGDDGGGGIFNNGGELNLSRSTISFNNADGAAGNGGGLHENGGTTTIEYSTVSGNSTVGNGGGIFGNGMVELTSTTITDNNATGNGGGIAQTSGIATLGSSIVAANTGTTGQDLAGMGTFLSGNYNLIGEDDANVFTPQANDKEGAAGSPIDPLLDVLADNGGSTFTHEIQCASPAIDSGDPGDSSPDQRDIAVVGGQRDIGSFERDNTPQANAAGTGLGSSSNGQNIYIIEVCGGTLPYSIEFSSSNAFASVTDFSGSMAGCIKYRVEYASGADWTLIVTDAEGCTSKDAIFTNEGIPTAPVPQVVGTPTTTPENCFQKDGSITITIEGGDDSCSDYSYTYDGTGEGSGTFAAPTGGGTSDLVITGVPRGVYDIVITDCAGTAIEVVAGVSRITGNGGRGRGRGRNGCSFPGKADIGDTLLEFIDVYPNPFETSTTLEFSLLESSHVTVAVFTMDGREVARVFEEQAEAGELYILPFNAENLPTGMYVVQITTDLGTTHHEKIYLAK